MQDRRRERGKLERVAIAAGDQRGATALCLARCRGGEEIVGLEACRLGIGKAAGGDEIGEHGQLLDDGRIEFAAGLVRWEQALAEVGHFQRIPPDHDRARPLLFEQSQQQIGEADDGAGRPPVAAPDRLRQRVKGAMGEIVAVDGEQGAGHARC